MRKFTCPISHKPTIWLSVDEYASATEGHVIKTVLGSCVALVIWDSEKRIFGVNHYLNITSGEGLSKALLDELKTHGGTRFKGYIYGGSRIHQTDFAVGEENIEFAQQFLKHHKISLIKEEVGGNVGRTIMVSLDDSKIDIKVEKHGQYNTEEDEPPSVEAASSEMRQTSQDAYNFIKKLMDKSKKTSE